MPEFRDFLVPKVDSLLSGKEGAEVAKPGVEISFQNIDKEKLRRRVLELESALGLWSSQSEISRGRFNQRWLEKNGFQGLTAWADRYGSLRELVDRASESLKKNFEKRTENRTIEGALFEFEMAFKKWKSLSGDERKAFNPTWLEENGFRSLSIWIKRNGGYQKILSLTKEEIRNVYGKKDAKSEKKLKEETLYAQGELQKAHAVWSLESEESRKRFNLEWLRKNGFRSLVLWMHENISIDELVNGLGSEVREKIHKDLSRGKGSALTMPKASKKLRQAYDEWKEEAGRGGGRKFNRSWLFSHGYGHIYSWTSTKGNDVTSFEELLNKAGSDIAADFQKETQNRDRTVDSARKELEGAYAHWKSLPEEGRGIFSPAWLDKNGYRSLNVWFGKLGRGDTQANVQAIGGEIVFDFQKLKPTKPYSLEEIRGELERAYKKWQNDRETNGEKFNAAWLVKNDFEHVESWLKRHKKSVADIFLNDHEVVKSFVKAKRENYTIPSVSRSIQDLYRLWVSREPKASDPFNTTWIINNGGSGLYAWLARRQGLAEVIRELGGEISANFVFPEAPSDTKGRERLPLEVREFASGGTLEAKIFQSLLGLCGSSRAADLLYRFRPEYKKLPLEYVRSMLGDYLGECMSVKRPFNFESVIEHQEYFSEPSLAAGLAEVIKSDCLAYYYRERKASLQRTDHEIIYAYLDRAVDALGDLHNSYIDNAVESVTEYFANAFSLEKPGHMVGSLSEGRYFPDVNQRINTKEIHDKRRMLIADEMGLGKSASVIFAKETLGIGTALLVVPSNVIELGTWQGYLSDDARRKGYFKEGKAPRVLVIESPKDLVAAAQEKYDYVIISHEKLNERSMPDLGKIEFDMLIVDEAHKMKATKGKRSDRLLRLAKQVEDGEKYLALLTATPAPNRVEDLAVSLKLLYPTEYANATPQDLAHQIIHGDVLDLREKLLQRMQMKSLEDSVEMPPLTEDVEIVKLSQLERDIYNAVVEDDELESTEKFSILRKMLLNIRQVDPTPGVETAKVRDLRESLHEKLKHHSKIVIFVNDYIENVMRGEDSIIPDLHIPEGVKVFAIHGENRSERVAIQEEFRSSSGKVVLFVSGQTSDVGVDFSAGDDVEFLNEPLTEYQRLQQRSRIYRPGIRRALRTKTYIAAGTIDEGIHEHIQAKFKAVEKILRGIPLSELDKRMLESESEEDMAETDVNPELGKFYFSTLQRLQKMFTLGKDIGEERFKEFIERFGKEYAEGYKTAGSRSYQANANRFASGLLEKFIRDRDQKRTEIKILDVPSGPEMLRRHSSSELALSIVSVDINKEHFTDARGEYAVGSFTNLPYEDATFDYLNCSLGLHYTSYRPSKDNYERVQALQEMNRVLKVGGRLVINEMFSLQFRSEEKFARIADILGFSVIKEFSGKAEGGHGYQSTVVTLEKKEGSPDLDEVKTRMEEEDLKVGLKWKTTAVTKLKDSRKIISIYSMNGRDIECVPNEEDQSLIVEEQRITWDGEALRDLYGGIASIPREEVIENRFIRVRPKVRHVLFRSLSAGNGAVIVRDEI